MKMTLALACSAAAAACLFAGAAQAAPLVGVGTAPGSLFNTTELTQFATNGADMVGTRVTVCTSVDPCETGVWAATGATTGGAAGTGWSLSLAADSFDSPFTFTATTAVTSFSVNGRPGRTIFDVVNGDSLSPNSFNGSPFALWDSEDTDLVGINTINVLYTDRLAVGGVFYGDLYTVMNVDFGGARFTGSFDFTSDTDNAAPGSPIVPVPVPVPVPEPASLALVGIGLLGLAAGRRRSRAIRA